MGKKKNRHMNRYQVLQFICRKALKMQTALGYMHEFARSAGLDRNSEIETLQNVLDSQQRFKGWMSNKYKETCRKKQ